MAEKISVPWSAGEECKDADARADLKRYVERLQQNGRAVVIESPATIWTTNTIVALIAIDGARWIVAYYPKAPTKIGHWKRWTVYRGRDHDIGRIRALAEFVQRRQRNGRRVEVLEGPFFASYSTPLAFLSIDDALAKTYWTDGQWKRLW